MNPIRVSKLLCLLMLFMLVACQAQAATPPASTAVPPPAPTAVPPPAATAAPATAVPATAATQALTPFSSKIYKLHMSVSFGPDWNVIDDYPDLVTLLKTREQIGYELGLNIVTDAKLADPVDGHLVPFPNDFVAWVKSAPGFIAGEAIEVIVGGIKGMQIDARTTTTEKKDYLHLAGGTIWYVNAPSGTLTWRFILLNDVNGERVLITFASPTDKFDSAMEAAQKILDSVVFRP